MKYLLLLGFSSLLFNSACSFEQVPPIPTEIKLTEAYKGSTVDSVYLRGVELNDIDPALAYVKNGHPPIEMGSKAVWVRQSSLWDKAPDFYVETFLNGDQKQPDMTQTLVLLNFWSSWCPPSRRSLPLMNHFQEKFKGDLIVINVSNEDPELIRQFLKKRSHYKALFANDQTSQMKDELTVYGVPHSILVEPINRTVIWEGFPLLKGSELTDTVIEKSIKVVKRQQAQQQGKKVTL